MGEFCATTLIVARRVSMKEIVITSTKDELILQQLNLSLGGRVSESWGERILTFDNEIGTGVFRSISFNWGVSLLDCDVQFKDDVKIIFKTSSVSPVEFIFISKGFFQYGEDNKADFIDLEQYQNIVIAPKRFSAKTFVFPPEKNVKVNFIRIVKKEYMKKKNSNVTYLNELMLSVFNDENASMPYKHAGSYSLKIAEQVSALNSVYESGIIRTISLEGRLYVILAMQLMEHHNFVSDMVLPESVSKNDIKKIHQLSEFIVDNISTPISVNSLAKRACISPKKLQLGFKVLYSKSVNEYVRQLKLEIARDYLRNTDLSVSEIVYSVGIKSRSYFSKIFSEAYGILPTGYRKQLIKKA